MKTKICTKCKIEKELFCFSKHKKYKDGYRSACKFCTRTQNKKYKNKENDKTYSKLWYIENKERILKYKKEYSDKNRVLLNKKYNFKYHNNSYYRLSCVLRTRLTKALKNNSKSKRTLELLGCSVEYLKKHLELKFKDNMTWDNYGDGTLTILNHVLHLI